MLEIAIVLPIFLLIIAAIAEFGQFFYYYTTLSKATRVGARYITSRVYTAPEQTKARNLVVCGSLNTCASGTEILPYLTTANVTITPTGGTTLFPQKITISITGYTYTPVFNMIPLTGVSISPSTTMRYLLEN